MKDFVEYLLAKGVSKPRVIKYVNQLVVLARMTRKPFERLKRRDIEELVRKVNEADYSEHTKRDFKIILKRFYQWLKGCSEEENEYPEEVRWIKTSPKEKRIMPEMLLTSEEIKKLVEVAENPRDKALVLTHYESGCRIGETLSLRIRNVKFDQYGAILQVNGKTGPRRVRIIAATPALAMWLSMHPFKGDPNSPLWIGMGTKGRYKPLDYHATRMLFKRLARKAGLNKRIYTHLFRHSRATELANVLTEAQMKELFGWTQSSDMPSVYVHLSGRDVDKALLKAYGIKEEEESKPALTTIECPRCKRKISSESQFCSNCGMALNIKATLILEEERAKADRIMDILMEDQEVRELIAKKLREHELAERFK
ncbi:MAG: tyrosine-type recombinase/integrase [Candidatus Baldrarchaeia archaeon]